MKGNLAKKLIFLVTFFLITLLTTTIFAVEAIATTKYFVKDDVIMRIEAGTTVKDFLGNVTVNSGANKSVYKGSTKLNDNDLLATGMLLKIGTDTTYNIAVRADANGDAKISATDLSLFKMHTTNLKLLEGIYEKAIDINCDLRVSMTDLSLMRMILVGLTLPGEELPNIQGDITILPNTTNYAKELVINVYWPDDTTGLTKQVSLDNGKTYQNYTGSLTMRANNTVIARLVDSNSRVIKSASLVITNIDNEGPAKFDVAVEHKITNYTVLSGTTTDSVSGIAGYYFSYDNGTNWYPLSGQLNGKYVFTDVPSNSIINLRMKAADRVGNEVLTDAKKQRTFKSGIQILKEKLTGVTIDEANWMITMPDGRVFRLAITEQGGYAIRSLGTGTDATIQLEEENMLNQKIAGYEVNGVLSAGEVLTRLTEEGLGTGTLEDGIFTTEKAENFIQYLLTTNLTGKHQMIFLKTITKNALTSSGQIKENEMLLDLDDLIVQMKKENPNVKILSILDKAVEKGLLLEENVNRNNGRFESEVGLTYQIMEHEGELSVELIGFAEDIENGYIEGKLLDVLEEGLKNQIIDWAVAEGLTAENKTSRVNGIYEDNNGTYREVTIDCEAGTYVTTQINRPEGAIIEYALTPDFPTMAVKTKLAVSAKGEASIAKIEVYTELGEAILSETYTDNQLTKTENIDISYNGTYKVKVTTSDGKVSEKEVLVSNIASILPIRVTIIPESPRNTIKEGTQNGIEAGPISVQLKFSDAPLLENEDKYQYQLNTTTGTWETADKEQLIEGITKNCKIYARYFDAQKGVGVKQVEIIIDTVDNIAPDAFEFTAVKTSNTITVSAEATDKATDSDGVVAREGVEGIGQYLYKLNDGEWQQNNIFENLTQSTAYKISVKAVDFAGNETIATNSNTDIVTETVPKASDVITFEYSTTEDTKGNVVVKFKSTKNIDAYTIQYQAISNGSQPVDENWIDGDEFKATENCKVYVRLVDNTGQTNANYKVEEITNIDKMGPTAFTPKLIKTTKNSIKINASSVSPGAAKDAPASNTSKSTGTVKYNYYITGVFETETSIRTTKIENQTDYTYEFTNLQPGNYYSIYVVAIDKVGNSTMSETITVVTNATLGKITSAHTTINGLVGTASAKNPIIPAGFAPVNESGVEWGDGTTTPAGWNGGLVITDSVNESGKSNGNEFVWVPVDGENVTFARWAEEGISHNQVNDGQGPMIKVGEDENGNEIKEELKEEAQIAKYGGFYIARTEAVDNGKTITSKVGERPLIGKNYSSAKSMAEEMYDSNLLQSGLVTGTQWDTMIKWLSIENEEILTSKEFGNFTGIRENTGSSENYKLNNIYDLSGNVQEITNEVQGNKVIVRGGAYDIEKNLQERYTYSQEYTNSDLGFRTVLYVIETDELVPTNPGALGIDNFNPGPGNVTINNGPASHNNPVIPKGFKAVNTPDAKWYGNPIPGDWKKGLVIEDTNGNQFVWVPVDNDEIKYEKWYTIYAPSSAEEEDIAGDVLPSALQELSIAEQEQIKTYGGFYIARYEAGNFEGTLVSKSGARPVNAVTYEEAKEYAEAMYTSMYVKSGLLTGTAWDTTMKWMASTNDNGENRVLNNKNSGNNPNAKFTFSGEYAEGPNSTTELRGEYKNGMDVTKVSGSRMLLATGIVEGFKTNNIYDMAGNVWEYTYEYTINEKGEKEYFARGADYYRKYSVAADWGAAIRENIVTKDTDRRNEGGFRVMLYLVEGTATVGKFVEENSTMIPLKQGQKQTYDNPIIPAGFAASSKGAKWGNTKETMEWDKGLVIEDPYGNEFVWVPVDNTNVKYEDWLQTGISYQETDKSEIPEIVVNEWKEKEITQIINNGGFYIARYESSRLVNETEVTAGSIAGAEAWTNIDYVTAKQMAEAIKTRDEVKVGLVTGTAWDTTMRWIANEKGSESYVAENSTSWGAYANSSPETKPVAKNIHLLAGGNWEWTSEKSGNNAVYRGGVRTDRGDSSPAGYRGTKATTTLDEATTFRMMLFITGPVAEVATKPVGDSEPLYGTKFSGETNAPKLVDGMTPVKWNGTTWVTTTADDPDWYKYIDTSLGDANTSEWANAKTPDGSMWVWIPRYAYKIEYTNPDKPSQGGEIKILFLDENTNEPLENTNEIIYARTSNEITTATNYIVHPAFRGDTSIGGWTEELTGIWVGKFETSGGSPATLGSKPGVASFGYDSHGSTQFKWVQQATLGYADLGSEPSAPYKSYTRRWVDDYDGGHYEHTYFYVYKGQRYSNYNEAVNLYSADLSEYLTKLAEFKAEVGFDLHMAKNTEWGAAAYLGHSAYGVNGNVVAANPTGTAGYQYTTNGNRSTTGNVYGVYDMAGGRMEYTSAYMGNWSSARFGNISNIVRADLKYKQIYRTYSYYGDATSETAGWQGSYSHNPNTYYWNHGSPRPLYVRGAGMSGGANTMFATAVQCSNTNFAYSFRMIMVNK